MKQFVLAAVIVFAAVISIVAQKIDKPTLTPKADTAAQTALIREGIDLHDQKNYTGAIAKYKQVLAENPDSAMGLYELALTYYTMGDKENASKTAYIGAKYHSEQLALFYGMIANVIDDSGKPEDALKLYQNAIKIMKGEPDAERHLSSLHFNMGITYTRQKKYTEARAELKKAIEYNYAYSSPHYTLSEVFLGTKYKVPALIVASRFVAMEFNTPRSKRSAQVISSIIDGAKKNDKGGVDINLDFFAPTDEGEFAMYDLILGTLMVIDEKKDEDKNKPYGQRFSDSMDSFIAMLSEDKKLKSTFVGKNYVPFFGAMKKEGHTLAWSYVVIAQAGENQDAVKWINANEDKVKAFFAWAKANTLPGK